MRFIIILLLIFAGCSDESNDYGAACGTVRKDKLYEKIDDKHGEQVEIVGVPAADLVSVVTSSGQSHLIKLQAITAKDRDQTLAINKIKSLASDNAYMFIADEECDFFADGGIPSQPGQLYTLSGLSFSEELLIEKLVDVDLSNACESQLLNSCYSSLFYRD